MYSLNQPSSNKVDALKKFTTVKNNISLYKSTFDFFHIYVFLQPDQLGSKESLYFFSTDELSAYGLDKKYCFRFRLFLCLDTGFQYASA